MQKSSTLIGTITGAAVASCLTLLITPASGKQLKSQYHLKTAKVKYSFKKAKTETVLLKKQTINTATLAFHTSKDVAKDINISVNEWKSEIKPIVAKLHSNLEQLQKAVTKIKEK